MVRRVWKTMSRFWETDESFSILVLLLVLFVRPQGLFGEKQ